MSGVGNRRRGRSARFVRVSVARPRTVLSVWFALHVIFADVSPGRLGPRVDPASLIPENLVYMGIAILLLLGLRLPLILCLGLMAAISGAAELLV